MNEQKLKEMMEYKSGSVRAFATEIDIPYTTIRSILERGVLNAKAENIFKICSALNIRPEAFTDLLDPTPTEAPSELVTAIHDKVVQLTTPRQESVLAYTTEQLEEQKRTATISEDVIDFYDTRKRISLPVPGKVSAGTGYWQEDDHDTMVDFYADDIPDKKDYDTIAVAVGHSMEPKIKNGDFLFIKLQDQVDLNKIGIFSVNGENYVKKLKSDHLESLNKDYDDIHLTENDDIRTIGEVVDIYREG